MAGANAGAIKARIIEHMNADHSDSLEDYLKFYNSINTAPGRKLLEKLTIRG
jgi:putative heme iron utilization protein